MSLGPIYRLHGEHKLQKPALIVAWLEDASSLGVRTVDYLIEGLGWAVRS